MKDKAVLKIGSNTSIAKLVRAIVKNIESNRVVHCDSMGPNAVFVCTKALIYAREELADENIKIYFTPSMDDVSVPNTTDGVRIKTAIRWTLTRSV